MTKDQVKQTAVVMVKESGLINLSRRELCQRAGIPDGSFPHVMGCNFTAFVAQLKDENIEQPVAPVSKSRVPANMRKEQILGVAIDQATEKGYHKITRDGVADAAGVSHSLVSRYFRTMGQLRTDVMRAAIKRGLLAIIAQGLVNGDERAKKAPDHLKEQAAELLATA